MIKYDDLPKVNTQRWLSLESLQGEVWKTIYGFEGLYEVSNYGRVKSLEREVENKRYSKKLTKFVPSRILKQTVSKKGYYRVGLSRNGNTKRIAVHVIVAKAFLPNPQACTQINHKDENKKNNIVFLNCNSEIDYKKSNLEWCTAKYNANYGTIKQRISEKLKNIYRSRKINSTPKIISQSDLEGNIIAIYPSTNNASKVTCIDRTGIARCCKGEYAKFKGYVWKYVL